MDIMQIMEMLGTSNIPLVAAFFIGLMMAISPCPLATNIAAIAYISKKLNSGKTTLFVGLAYTLGRMFTYILIAAPIVWLGVNVPAISFTLQKYGEPLLGPVLILVGVVLLDVLKINLDFGGNRLEKFKNKLSDKGLFGSFLLGAIFALAFCPFSAVLFFGILIPIALKAGDGLFIPGVFALATGLPVIIFSLILTYSLSSLGKTMHKVQYFEKNVRKGAAIILVLVGIYYLLKYTLGLI